MKNYITLALFIFSLTYSFAQSTVSKKSKLVVGIVVDQMRYDYLTRFWDKYGEEGFKRMIKEGYNFKNNHFNYVPTYTGPGHTSVFTGTTPINHGIISNSWFDKKLDKNVYCVQDNTMNPIGTNSEAGKKSPHRMKSATVADMNRLHSQMKGKTIGIALKDRAAILPAGHTANAAYWFQGGKEGNFISSSYYMDELPRWVKKFNKSSKAESYLKVWNTLYDISTYTESGDDDNNFEGGYKGKEKATFPYDLNKLKKQNNGFDMVLHSAYGDDLTADFAMAAIEGEKLGQDNYTDFLTLSFSSTDKVGHNFGVNSKEVEDTYLRLDKSLAKVLSFLDKKVGEGNYTVFLTADHGGGNVPAYLQSENIPGGYFDISGFKKGLNGFVEAKYGNENIIKNVSNNQVFLDYKVLEKKEIEAEQIQNKIAHYILAQNKISRVFTRSQLESGSYDSGIGAAVQAGFNQKRSGDIVYVLDPATIVKSKTGSTHGSPYDYDTHVPLIFFGNGVMQGSTTQRTEITDVAPTVSAILGIAFPNTATGEPLYMMLD